VVAVGVENVGQKGDGGRQAIAEVADAVVLGKSAGEDAGVRDGSNGRLGIGVIEDYALAGQRIELRS